MATKNPPVARRAGPEAGTRDAHTIPPPPDTRKALTATEGEIAVLGACLIDADAILLARRLLSVEAFAVARHRVIYRAMLRLADAGQPIDPVTLSEDLTARGELADAGGMAYIAELLDAVPTAANLEYHARIVADRAARRRLHSIGHQIAAAAADPDLDLADIRARLEQHACEAAGLEAVTRDAAALGVRSLLDILADPTALEPPEPVVPRLAWAGRVTLLAAREKAGKSTLATAAAASVSHGASFLGEPCPRGKVLWIALEEHTADLATRFVHFQADAEQVFVLDRLNDPLADVAAAVEQVRPRLVVLDTLPALAALVGESPEPGSSTDWTPIMSALTRPARDFDAAMLILHHARKSDGQYRDSTAIGANVDMILEMTEGDDGVRKIKARGRWDVGDYAVRLAGAQFELVSGELSIDAQILLYVERNPECSTRDVRANVKGKRANEIDAAIRRLLEAGALVNVGDTRGRRLKVCPDRVPTVSRGFSTGGRFEGECVP